MQARAPSRSSWTRLRSWCARVSTARRDDLGADLAVHLFRAGTAALRWEGGCDYTGTQDGADGVVVPQARLMPRGPGPSVSRPRHERAIELPSPALHACREDERCVSERPVLPLSPGLCDQQQSETWRVTVKRTGEVLYAGRGRCNWSRTRRRSERQRSGGHTQWRRTLDAAAVDALVPVRATLQAWAWASVLR